MPRSRVPENRICIRLETSIRARLQSGRKAIKKYRPLGPEGFVKPPPRASQDLKDLSETSQSLSFLPWPITICYLLSTYRITKFPDYSILSALPLPGHPKI